MGKVIPWLCVMWLFKFLNVLLLTIHPFIYAFFFVCLSLSISLSVCLVLNDIIRTWCVMIIVPPKIEPFSFQEGLSEKMMTRLVCGVSQGDLPIEFSWFKDGKQLSKDDPWTNNIEISTLDPFSTLLRFSSLSSSHAGLYTCQASNPASRVHLSAKLVVQGKIEIPHHQQETNRPSAAPLLLLLLLLPKLLVTFRLFPPHAHSQIHQNQKYFPFILSSTFPLPIPTTTSVVVDYSPGVFFWILNSLSLLSLYHTHENLLVVRLLLLQLLLLQNWESFWINMNIEYIIETSGFEFFFKRKGNVKRWWWRGALIIIGESVRIFLLKTLKSHELSLHMSLYYVCTISLKRWFEMHEFLKFFAFWVFVLTWVKLRIRSETIFE